MPREGGGIQYSRALSRISSGAEYWIVRWSPSSGSRSETRWRSMTVALWWRAASNHKYSSDLRHRGDDPRDVLWPRQAVIAVLDHGQHHVIARQPMCQREGVLPRYVRVLRTLQDANRAPHTDGAAEQQLIATLLDQCACERIRLAILRWPQPHALALDLPADLGRKPVPHQRFGKIRRRRDQHQAGQRCAAYPAPRDLARQQERHPATHR